MCRLFFPGLLAALLTVAYSPAGLACDIRGHGHLKRQYVAGTIHHCIELRLVCLRKHSRIMYPYDFIAVYRDGSEQRAISASGLDELNADENRVRACFRPWAKDLLRIYSEM